MEYGENHGAELAFWRPKHTLVVTFDLEGVRTSRAAQIVAKDPGNNPCLSEHTSKYKCDFPIKCLLGGSKKLTLGQS